MDNTNDVRKRKFLLIGTVLINIGILFFFKYFNFFIETFVDAFLLMGMSINVTTLHLLLPVGISFYTFTALSYSIDVYLHKVESTNDVLAYFAYVMFFPSILSGPISRAQKQLPQYFSRRDFDFIKSINAC